MKKVQQKKQINPRDSFISKMAITDNISNELTKASLQSKVPTVNLDFKIIETITYMRLKESIENTEIAEEWEEVEVDQLVESMNKRETAEYLNENFKIKQMHKIEIFYKEELNGGLENVKVIMAADKAKCKIYIRIKKSSEVVKYNNFVEDMILLIQKFQAKNKILIGVFDLDYRSELEAIEQNFKIEEDYIFVENKNVMISKSISKTESIDDKWIYPYKKKKKKNSSKVDYANRGYLSAVDKGEVIIKYIKAKTGKPGRDCRGIYLPVKKVDFKNSKKLKISKEIEVKETESEILYVAKESGYIIKKMEEYSIGTEVKIAEVNFKKTGNIQAKLTSNICLSINESSAVRDAIGSGIKIEVKDLIIEGIMAGKSSIKAERVLIKGMVHKDAIIKASTEFIGAVFKGEVFSPSVYVERLEHGTINSKQINIHEAAGGVVFGHKVEIDNCFSYTKVTAMKTIKIKRMYGAENTFTINPFLYINTKDKKEQVKQERKKLHFEIMNLQGNIKKIENTINTNKSSFNNIKAKLIKFKKQKVTPPMVFVNQYKAMHLEIGKLKDLNVELKKIEDHLQLISRREVTSKKEVYDTFIRIEEGWRGHNTIIFVLESGEELRMSVNENTKENTFKLIRVDNEFKIQGI